MRRIECLDMCTEWPGGVLEGWGDQKLLSHGAQKRSHHASEESNGWKLQSTVQTSLH